VSRQKGLIYRGLILAGAMLATGLVALPLGYAISHERVVLVAGAAAGVVCLLAGWAGLGLGEIFHRPEHSRAFIGLGMIFRMGMPLGAVLMVYFLAGPLASECFLYYLVGFYPVMLAVETFLTLPAGPSDASDPAPRRQPPC
jgi:hypothetical protein